MSRIPQRRFGRRAPVRRFSRTCSAPPPPPSNRTEGLRAAGAVTCRVRCRRQGRVRWECGEWRRRERPFPTKIGTLALAVARKGEIHVEFNNKAASRTKIEYVELMLDAALDVMAASAFPTMPASSTSAAAPVTTSTPRATSPSLIPHQGCQGFLFSEPND